MAPGRSPKNGHRARLQIEFAPQLSFSRKLAAEVAIEKEIEPTESELDGAVYLFLFKSFLKLGDMANCETFAGPAFDLTREDTSHCVFQRQWAERLIELSNFARADQVTLQYLEDLSGDDTSHPSIKNRIKFWAESMAHSYQSPASSFAPTSRT